jgi:hypothetical protein
MTDSKTPHYLIDFDLYSVAYLGIGNKDHESFYSGNAIAFAGNVLNTDVILFFDLYWGRSAHGGPIFVVTCQNISPSLEKLSDFMTDGKAPHYLVDLDRNSVAYLGISHEDHKSFHSGNAVAFAGNVLNIDIVLISNNYGSSWIGPSHGRSFLASEQIFTVLRENYKIAFAISFLVIRLLNPFAPNPLIS